jgi:hypothetical protein
MGGEVTVESKVKAGSTFTITLKVMCLGEEDPTPPPVSSADQSLAKSYDDLESMLKR